MGTTSAAPHIVNALRAMPTLTHGPFLVHSSASVAPVRGQEHESSSSVGTHLVFMCPMNFSSSEAQVCKEFGESMAPKKSGSNSKFKGEAFERGLDIGGMHKVWDSMDEVRSRLRAGGTIMHEETGLCCDNRVSVLNKQLLGPLLQGMAGLTDRKLPSVGDLRQEIMLCFSLNKRVGKDLDEKVALEAMHLRKLLSFIKAKCRRAEVSNELWVETIIDNFPVYVKIRFHNIYSFFGC